MNTAGSGWPARSRRRPSPPGRRPWSCARGVSRLAPGIWTGGHVVTRGGRHGQRHRRVPCAGTGWTAIAVGMLLLAACLWDLGLDVRQIVLRARARRHERPSGAWSGHARPGMPKTGARAREQLARFHAPHKTIPPGGPPSRGPMMPAASTSGSCSRRSSWPPSYAPCDPWACGLSVCPIPRADACPAAATGRRLGDVGRPRGGHAAAVRVPHLAENMSGPGGGAVLWGRTAACPKGRRDRLQQ